MDMGGDNENGALGQNTEVGNVIFITSSNTWNYME